MVEYNNGSLISRTKPEHHFITLKQLDKFDNLLYSHTGTSRKITTSYYFWYDYLILTNKIQTSYEKGFRPTETSLDFLKHEKNKNMKNMKENVYLVCLFLLALVPVAVKSAPHQNITANTTNAPKNVSTGGKWQFFYMK